MDFYCRATSRLEDYLSAVCSSRLTLLFLRTVWVILSLLIERWEATSTAVTPVDSVAKDSLE